jgi:hypothetical protein
MRPRCAAVARPCVPGARARPARAAKPYDAHDARVFAALPHRPHRPHLPLGHAARPDALPLPAVAERASLPEVRAGVRVTACLAAGSGDLRDADMPVPWPAVACQGTVRSCYRRSIARHSAQRPIASTTSPANRMLIMPHLRFLPSQARMLSQPTAQ